MGDKLGYLFRGHIFWIAYCPVPDDYLYEQPDWHVVEQPVKGDAKKQGHRLTLQDKERAAHNDQGVPELPGDRLNLCHRD